MNTQGDWGRWQQQWQQQAPMPDIDRLHRQVRRKRRWMVATVVFEALALLFALVQLIRLQFLPQLPLRWHVGGFALLGFCVALEWFAVHFRRGTWQLATIDSHALLELSARRARSGIRLAWLQVWALVVVTVIAVIAGWPWLQPERWQHDPRLRSLLELLIGMNAILLIGGMALSLWGLRRQRRRLQQFEAWLRE